MPVGLRSKSTLTHLPTLPSGEESLLLGSFCLCFSKSKVINCSALFYQSNKSILSFFLLHSSVRHPLAALPQVSVVPPLWTSVQTKHTLTAQLTPKQNHSLSAQCTPQVPSIAPFIPLKETRAPLNAPFTRRKQTRQQSAPSMLQGPTAAQTVPFTLQGRLQTAPCIPQGLRMAKAIMTVPCMGRGPSQNHPQTAHFTPQGFKSVSAPRNQTPRMRRPKQGTIGLASIQVETREA